MDLKRIYARIYSKEIAAYKDFILQTDTAVLYKKYRPKTENKEKSNNNTENKEESNSSKFFSMILRREIDPRKTKVDFDKWHRRFCTLLTGQFVPIKDSKQCSELNMKLGADSTFKKELVSLLYLSDHYIVKTDHQFWDSAYSATQFILLFYRNLLYIFACCKKLENHS